MEHKFTHIHKALAEIYIDLELTANPSDVHDSRPRKLSNELTTSFVDFCHTLERHYNVAEDSFILGARPFIRNAIPLRGVTLGYTDEGLDLAQMVHRAVYGTV
tara:strand:+ start:158 stop:466 length:309 start_codon:yes stop_codon:yes gene_type:complete